MMFPLEVTVCADNLKDSVRGLEVLSKESKLSRSYNSSSSLRAFGGITGAISPAGAHTLLGGAHQLLPGQKWLCVCMLFYVRLGGEPCVLLIL